MGESVATLFVGRSCNVYLLAAGLWAKRASETSKPGMAASDALENPLSPSLGQGPAEGSIDIGSPSAIEVSRTAAS